MDAASKGYDYLMIKPVLWPQIAGFLIVDAAFFNLPL